ncbi:hypothetical protein [Staphylococcus warneri]|uniref:hypothetical protein n=1 Tax=Staphylococcus warneri TaxID=1292 RepID=UPI00215D92F5|nr:hypothetical protein [Staphylococcus warneri]
MGEYTPKEVITMLREYKDDKQMYERLLREYEQERETASVGAAQYGLESVMPKANGVSNPTQKAAERLLIKDGTISRTKRKLDFIDERAKRIHKNQHIVTFALRTEGNTCNYIASVLEVKRTRVQNIINEIAQLMCKDEEEYRIYCEKKKINPMF